MQGFSLADMEWSSNITGIENGATSIAPSAFNAFDMNGRRVEAKSTNDLQPGIYVVNGKKIIK